MLVGLMYGFGIGVSVNCWGFIPEPGGLGSAAPKHKKRQLLLGSSRLQARTGVDGFKVEGRMRLP